MEKETMTLAVALSFCSFAPSEKGGSEQSWVAVH